MLINDVDIKINVLQGKHDLSNIVMKNNISEKQTKYPLEVITKIIIFEVMMLKVNETTGRNVKLYINKSIPLYDPATVATSFAKQICIILILFLINEQLQHRYCSQINSRCRF